jgi:hypothetical protein
MPYTKEDAKMLGRQLASMNDGLQAIALATMASEANKWSKTRINGHFPGDDLSAAQWVAIADRINNDWLTDFEKFTVRKMISIIAANIIDKS